MGLNNLDFSMDYSDLNKQTQTFLNKAIDVYLSVRDKSIVKIVKEIVGTKKHEFTKLDKKVLSLFIAGFLVDGNLKELLSQYDDIKLDNLFDFVGIEESDITPLTEVTDDNYENFYMKNFQLDLMSIIRERNYNNEIKTLTPEVIIKSLQYIDLSGSKVLDYFATKYGIAGSTFGFHDHPFFKALESFVITDGSISRNESPRTNRLPSFIEFLNGDSTEKPEEKPETHQSPQINLDDEKIWLLLEDIQKKFIGQELAAESLFYNIVNNQQLAQMHDLPDGQRSIIFLDGPTGTGKTAITREITEKLSIPFTSTSITNYSSTGYVGGDITDTLKDLYKKANGDLETAQRGIIVFDEFDKISYSRSGGLEMKRAVQQQLLDFLGGGKYTIRVGDSLFDRKDIEFDTSKLTFICLAALSDLRSKKEEKKQSIGFEQSSKQNEQQEYSITPQDLIDIGLERELVGRLNTYLHTDDYSRENLIKILKESTISPLIGFRKWIESKGKKLEIEDNVYDLIVDQAYKLNTGARSLQTVMNNIRTHFIKEVLRGTSETIYLDCETVEKIIGQSMNRKGRI